MIAKTEHLSKKELAARQGISRSSLYYRPRMPAKDWHLKNLIEATWSIHQGYGHKRLSDHLGINKKRILRVMKLFNIKPYRRRGKKFKKSKENGCVYPNLLQLIPFPNRANLAWASDFTELSFHGRIIYLATIMDLFNRRIVGWSVLLNHSVQLVISALIDAVEKHGRPTILHSDQGAEYKSKLYGEFAQNLGIRLSMSQKASPWQNGYQESWYDKFKVDFGDPNRFKTLGELTVAIYRQIYYYNNNRIQSILRMPPETYAQKQSILTANITTH